MKALKIATFNINGIRSRLPALRAWLEREKPDIALPVLRTVRRVAVLQARTTLKYAR